MKYLFFTAAVLGILPAVIFLLCDRRWIRWTTLGLFLPLLMFDSTAINFFSHATYRGTARGMEISLIYIVAVILLITIFLLRGPFRIFPGLGSWIYLVYFLSCIPSFTNAENCLISFFELWKMIMIYLVYLAVYTYLEYSKGDFDILLYGAAITVAFNFQAIIRQHFSGVYQVRGTFPHQNSLAMYMMMAGMLFFARYFNNREQFKSKIFFAAFVMASIALVRTYSRGALACYPLAGVIAVFCSLRSGLSLRKMYLICILSMIGLAGLMVFLPRVIQRFQTAPEASGQTRKNLAIAALNMMKDKPLAGVGLNNWGIKINPPYTYSQHRDPKRGYSDDYKDGIVETIYLLVGAECGIPSLLLLLSWFGFHWLSSIRLMSKLRGSPYFYIPVGIFAGLTGAFLQSALEWVLKQQINFMWMIMLFAMISYLNRHCRELSGGQLSAGRAV